MSAEQMHTPTAENTPWTVRRDDSGGEIGLWSVIDTKGEVVFFGMEEGEARLFAAGPDMLEALKQLVEWRGERSFENPEAPDALLPIDEQVFEIADAMRAIAKACPAALSQQVQS